MKKQFLLLLVAGFALAGCNYETIRSQNKYSADGYEMKTLDCDKVTVTFYKNIGKEELDLNSGMYASGTTTALKIDKIDKGAKATRPERDPMRQNYDFAGWHTDQTEASLFDFDTEVGSNLVLYAHWTKTQEEEFVEPEYVEPSHIDDSIDALVSISGVLNIPVNAGSVGLSNAAILRLMKKQIPETSTFDVTDTLNYKIKTGVTLTAVFNGTNEISFEATKDGEPTQNGTISVSNIATSLKVSNTTYENKAANYEANDNSFEDHRIMLAGSSSIENWKASGNDLLPMKTYNHGIGGTTVEMWRDKLNQRLVYPYSPKIVVYYVGVNNMKDGVNTGAETGQWLTEMFDDVHAHLPNTHIYYILVNELPGFRNRQEQFDIANQICLNYETAHKEYITCLNAGVGLLKPNGEPNQAYFLTDGIHMSLAGYAIWGKFIRDKLIADFKNA